MHGTVTPSEHGGGFSSADLSAVEVALRLGEAWDARTVVVCAGPPAADAGLRDLFHSWGLIWRTKARDAEVVRLISIDPHSPEEFRANAVVRNVDEFAEVFGTQPGDALWLDPAERVRIW